MEQPVVDWTSPEMQALAYQAAYAEDAQAACNRDQAHGGELGWCESCGSLPGYGIKHLNARAASLGGRSGCIVVLCKECYPSVKGVAALSDICRYHEWHG